MSRRLEGAILWTVIGASLGIIFLLGTRWDRSETTSGVSGEISAPSPAPPPVLPSGGGSMPPTPPEPPASPTITYVLPDPGTVYCFDPNDHDLPPGAPTCPVRWHTPRPIGVTLEPTPTPTPTPTPPPTPTLPPVPTTCPTASPGPSPVQSSPPTPSLCL